jgi:hypothetical protein
MTIGLALLGTGLVWLGLWLEDRHFRRAHPPAPRTLRCLCCDGAPLVDDMATHTRLVHMPRKPAVEDFPEWSNQK